MTFLMWFILYVFCDVCIICTMHAQCDILPFSNAVALSRLGGRVQAASLRKFSNRWKFSRQILLIWRFKRESWTCRKRVCNKASNTWMKTPPAADILTVSVWARNSCVFLFPYSRLIFFHFWVFPQVINSPRKRHCRRSAHNYMLNAILPGPCWVFEWP